MKIQIFTVSFVYILILSSQHFAGGGSRTERGPCMVPFASMCVFEF